ncbi:MAG: zinc-ribbon domain-containing protein [Muribaculaceae bacterium]|nr:zinc-ribbon domain-containing protein [Muribaculaceae bacterium]
MKVVCPYCSKEMNVSETELAEHGNSMVCPQCLMQFPVSGNEQALAELQASRKADTHAAGNASAARYSYCPHCGKQLPADGLNFCPFCGDMLRAQGSRRPESAATPPPLPAEAFGDTQQGPADEMTLNEFDFIHAYPYARSHHSSSRHVESRRERVFRRLAYVLICLLLVAIVALFIFMSKSEAPFATN